ncbi:MAG: hypothetical protein KDB94_04350 [Acidobacteria bacterium]|nr:hypothetical protein [Acidobacteriota bacterium]MCB9377435.1 hypothetical protein [Holophagales bacterium]
MASRRFAGIALSAVCLAPLVACGRAPAPNGSAGQAAAAPAPTQAHEPSRKIPDEATRAKLAGWWLRHDQSYMIVIDAIDERGQVAARYLNPQPINVSKAESWVEDGTVHLLLELTDQNYPGNYYELNYQPDQDLWLGLYHHLGIGQDYEVYFVRFEDEEE